MNMLRDPKSSMTHLIGGGLSIIALVMMLSKLVLTGNTGVAFYVASMMFGISMILLYLTSGIYHAISDKYKKAVKILRKLDHSMIYVLIAGSYSPLCLLVLPRSTGIPVLVFLWSIALVGIIMKVCWMNQPRIFSTMIYIVMGWTALFVVKDLYAYMDLRAFVLLFLGGVFYTIGGVIYAIKKPNIPNWSFHDIFHIFVMLGTLSHFLMVYLYII